MHVYTYTVCVCVCIQYMYTHAHTVHAFLHCSGQKSNTNTSRSLNHNVAVKSLLYIQWLVRVAVQLVSYRSVSSAGHCSPHEVI